MAGEWKKGAVPEKWDGHAAERIVAELERLLGRFVIDCGCLLCRHCERQRGNPDAWGLSGSDLFGWRLRRVAKAV
jgi:hypothetical protein